MASDDPNYNVAAALFESASGWLRKKGRVEMMGPIDYSTNYVCGLLIDGFQFPPTILTAHNPPYYARLIESCGFTKAKDWYAWWFSEYPAPAERLRKIALARAGKLRIKIRPIKPKEN
jgi:hypothetical protein